MFDETVPEDKKIDAIIASASVPLIFPAVNIDDHVLVDGGIFDNINLSEAVLKCRDFGFDDKDIIVDMIMCHNMPMNLKQYLKDESWYLNAFEMFSRKLEMTEFYGTYEDVVRVVRGFPHV